MIKKEKFLSLIPALWASLFDISITTAGQSKEYWNGDLGKANEGNPIGALFMQHHVAGLFIISTLWILVIVLLGYLLPKRLAKIFLLFCVIAHSYGASSWINGKYGFWLAMGFILFNSILFCVVDNRKEDKVVSSRY